MFLSLHCCWYSHRYSFITSWQEERKKILTAMYRDHAVQLNVSANFALQKSRDLNKQHHIRVLENFHVRSHVQGIRSPSQKFEKILITKSIVLKVLFSILFDVLVYLCSRSRLKKLFCILWENRKLIFTITSNLDNSCTLFGHFCRQYRTNRNSLAERSARYFCETIYH